MKFKSVVINLNPYLITPGRRQSRSSKGRGQRSCSEVQRSRLSRGRVHPRILRRKHYPRVHGGLLLQGHGKTQPLV